MKKLQVKVILKDEKEKKASQGHNVFYFESKEKIGEFMASLGDGFSFYTGGVLKKDFYTYEEEQKNSMRARLRVLQSLEKNISQEIRGWYEWEIMTPQQILKVAKMIQQQEVTK